MIITIPTIYPHQFPTLSATTYSLHLYQIRNWNAIGFVYTINYIKTNAT